MRDTVRSTGTSLTRFYPVTLRGALLASFLAFLVAGPVYHESDIVASVLAYTLGAVLVFLALCTVVNGTILKRTMRFDLVPPPPEALFAAEPQLFILRAGPGRMLPFFGAEISFSFSGSDLQLLPFFLSKSSSGTEPLPLTLAFPHRGNWTVSSMTVRFGDVTGLSSYTWSVPGTTFSGWRVLPPPVGTPALPILSSSHRAGDLVIDRNNRLGDPFDLKPYHPSDGLKKIVWKLFAKSGQLVARHPEASMTPEGQTLIFVVADDREDHVCAVAEKYVASLEELGIDVLLGCVGMDGGAASSAEATRELLINSVWEARSEEQTERYLNGFVAEIRSRLPTMRIERLILLCSERRLTTPERAERLSSLGDALKHSGIDPVYVLLRDEGAIMRETVTAEPAQMSLVHQWFWARTEGVGVRVDPAVRNRFFDGCVRNDWQVIT